MSSSWHWGCSSRSATGSARSQRRRSCAWPDRPTGACPGGWRRRSSSRIRPGTDPRQLGTLTTLAWHHFIRSLWGTAEQSAEAEGFAVRLAELAEELGAADMVVHGRSLLAIMARFSGRLDEAARQAEVLERLEGTVDAESYPWIGRAATFVVPVARVR